MGVHGLWDLLAPVGRRVSVETLAGKKLAIDASIWMIQFMKAMRDEKGEMVRNAHLLGFFRRICKLLYLRCKPIFVFDGATPALKRRTVIARRRQRENAQAKIRKTAEKLLLNHLKSMRLKELAKDIENQRRKQKADDVMGEKNLSDQTNGGESKTDNRKDNMETNRQEMLDEMLAASIAAEEDENSNNKAYTTAMRMEGEEYDDENEEMILDKGNQNKDHKSDAKGKEILIDLTEIERDNIQRDDLRNREKLDEMLAASIGAEEGEGLTKIVSTSAAASLSEEKDDDEDEEMILPAMCGEVDPAVLAALPPSMQLDLLVQMRERLMAENRQKYQKVKKAPEKFSELQIEAYLKTVAFRREMDQVQKAATGNDVGGVQSSRIASEANREFIFSSSFTGDKQLLRTTGAQKNGNKQQTPTRNLSSDSTDCVASASKSDAFTGLVQDESRRVFNEDIETFLDERGHIRVSRVRAMGMHLTRDLQRNLELMKEIEEERTFTTKTARSQSELGRGQIGSPKSIPSNKLHVISSHDKGVDSTKLNERNQYSFSNNKESMQISFEFDDRSKSLESDDDIFTSLVAGQPFKTLSADDRQASDSGSGSDWEEGIIERRGNSSSNDLVSEVNPPPKDSDIGDDDEVDWEDESGDHEKSLPFETSKPPSRGYMEEEADLQEAIRRSLEDLGVKKFNNSSSDLGKLETSEDQQHFKLSEAHDSDNVSILERDLDSNDGQPNQNMNLGVSIRRDIPCAESAAPLGAKDAQVIVEKSSDTAVEGMGLSASASNHSGVSDFSKVISGRTHFAVPFDDEGNKSEAGPSLLANEEKKTEWNPLTCGIEPPIGSTPVIDFKPKLDREKNSNIQYDEQVLELDKIESNEDLAADFSEATLQDDILILGQESKNLESVQKKLERDAESVSSEMFAECQELLQIFGLPYIIAPMEAEAQCAYMELANLVDGVVTDDSDVFLFGARNVYKNIFDDRKYVETYFMKDIEKELGLTREKLVQMALLLGSDYTEGISGIGIVNAIEVLNAFPEEDGLEKFREWIESPDPTILKNFQVQGGMGMRNNGNSNSAHDSMQDNSFIQDISEAHKKECSPVHIQRIRQDFMDKHRNVSKNWHVPSSFPNGAVISAYMCPQVDKSTEPFTWGKPDLHVLRRLCWERFAWNIQKSDELLLPVLKEYNKHETQLRLEAFYTFNERFAKIRSKRIKKALKGITRHQSLELMEDDKIESSKTRKKRTDGLGETCESTCVPSKRAKESVPSVETSSSLLEKSATKRSSKRTSREAVSADVDSPGHEGQAEGRVNTHNGNHGNRGRGRGRGDRFISQKRKRKGSETELSDSSDDHDSSAEDELEVCVGKSEMPQKARRSMRPRKDVNYTGDDSEVDVDRSPDHSNQWSNDMVVKTRIVTAEGGCRDACTTFSGQEQHKMDDPFPEDFSDIHLEKGDGFTIDGNGSGKTGVDQNSHPSMDEMSKEYLKFGGGFCVDESETSTNQESSTMPASGEVAEFSNLSGVAEDNVRDKSSVPSISSTRSALNDMQDTEQIIDRVNGTDSGDCSKVDLFPPESIGSKIVEPRLSAMPYLKRKRKKK